MGACLSCSSRTCKSASSKLIDTIRLVHFNGYVEDFNHPLSVGEVIGKPPKQYVFSAAQLVSVGFKPLTPHTQLQPGRVYFVLPLSALCGEVSPLDMATMASRLTARAKPVTPSPCISVSSISVKSSPDRSARRQEGKPTWKPTLDAIRELSFTRRSE